jgi:hypothetical protein
MFRIPYLAMYRPVGQSENRIILSSISADTDGTELELSISGDTDGDVSPTMTGRS